MCTHKPKQRWDTQWNALLLSKGIEDFHSWKNYLLFLSSFLFWEASVSTEHPRTPSTIALCVCVCYMKGSWFPCPDTKPWAQTGSFTQTPCTICVCSGPTPEPQFHTHPSRLIILSSVSIFNPAHNTNTQIYPHFPFHHHTLTDIQHTSQSHNHSELCDWLVVGKFTTGFTQYSPALIDKGLSRRTHTQTKP